MKVDKHKLHDLFLNAKFNEEQTKSLAEFYEEQKPVLEKLFTKTDIDSFFYDLQWRFEVKVSPWLCPERSN